MSDNKPTRTLARDIQVGGIISTTTDTSQRPSQMTVSKVTPIKRTQSVRIEGVDTETGELRQFDYWEKAEFYK
jgi:hypothetical protein